MDEISHRLMTKIIMMHILQAQACGMDERTVIFCDPDLQSRIFKLSPSPTIVQKVWKI